VWALPAAAPAPAAAAAPAPRSGESNSKSSRNHGGASSSPASSPTTGGATATAAPGGPLTISPAERAALYDAIQVYVNDQSLACKLVYNGGAYPGTARIIKNVNWVDGKRPKLFSAVLHNNKHGVEPVFFSTSKCISLTRIDLNDKKGSSHHHNQQQNSAAAAAAAASQ
jgi:hypothetical protein